MAKPIDAIHVTVEYFDGQEEGDVGYPYYVASCLEIAAVSDGKSLDELMTNIRESIDGYVEVAGVAEGMVPGPRIVVTIELPSIAKAA